MRCWRYLPADVQRLANTYRTRLGSLDLHVNDDGSINSTPQAAAEYVAWALWEANCPLPDVFYAATLAAVKFATRPQEIDPS